MGLHRFKKGLDLPLAGPPAADLEQAPHPTKVAVIALDFPGMKPQMMVAEGDRVRVGQPLFEDKKNPGVLFTSIGAGSIAAINRGAKRALQSVVIQLDGEGTEAMRFQSHTGQHPSALDRASVQELLIESGMWTAFRARPYGRVAVPDTEPKSIFVTAMDSNPLAPDLDVAVSGRESDLERGLAALTKLTNGTVYVCREPGAGFSVPALDRVSSEEFQGPHPAGTAGLHVHTLDPVNRAKLVWTIGVQDVLAIGALFESGELDLYRTISLAGPVIKRPRHLRVRQGHSIDALVSGEIAESDQLEDGPLVRELGSGPSHRVIAGSVLSGRHAEGDVHGYLGRFDQQVSVIEEHAEREFLGWMGPGVNQFSVANLFVSALTPGKKFKLNTSTNGSHRAIVPIGLYEKVVPFDVLPTFLLKSIVMGDVERAEALGALELVEEDLSLCTFVCPGKIDYGPHLRDTLTILEKEG